MPKQDTPQYDSLVDGLKRIYKGRIRPLETAFHFDTFYSHPLSDVDIEAKPMVLLLGQYSVGKTTFVEHLLGKPYPGAHIGPEPTTDRFVAVMGGDGERVIPGPVATIQSDRPFAGLSQFGASFMNKFQVSMTNSALLQSVTIVDSPGVLSGDQQRLGRAYDFVKVCEWFAERSDLILLLFDAHKLDISDELKRVIQAIRPFDDKLRIVLNKADTVTPQQLMRVYGALMWSLGKVIQTPEVIRVFIGSFHANSSLDSKNENSELLTAEQRDLINELEAMPKNAAIRRVNDIIRRARLTRVHVLLLNHLRNQMPSWFGRSAKQDKLIKNLSQEFTVVQKLHNLPIGDFPDFEKFQEALKGIELNDLPRLSNKATAGLEAALTKELPQLLSAFPQSPKLGFGRIVNPFTGACNIPSDDKGSLEYNSIDHEAHRRIFLALKPKNDALSGPEAGLLFSESGLNKSELGKIWNLADGDRDGALTFDEFSIALHLIKLVKAGHPLPASLPGTLRAPE